MSKITITKAEIVAALAPIQKLAERVSGAYRNIGDDDKVEIVGVDLDLYDLLREMSCENGHIGILAGQVLNDDRVFEQWNQRRNDREQALRRARAEQATSTRQQRRA